MENLLANEERGREASGIAVIHDNGEHQVFKAAVPASVLINLPGFLAALGTVGSSTVCLLGHTRRPTQGSPENPDNNHPIITPHVIGIHNGEIRNDEHLSLRHALPRTAEVDSEALFQLIDAAGPVCRQNGWSAQLTRGLAEVKGWFATLSVDLRRPTELLVLKKSRPLSLHYEGRYGALFFSSRYVFLRNTFGREVISETLLDAHGFCFDAQRLQELGSQPASCFSLEPEIA